MTARDFLRVCHRGENMILNYLLCAFLGYFLGAMPFALLLVKIFTKKDVRKEGSGNVGAMNSYDITGKKWLGVIVMLLDISKGFLAPFIADLFFNGDILCISFASVFVIIGHNYNVFLGFKGGRGLASAAGVSLYINGSFLVIWLAFYAIFYFGIFKNVHLSSFLACLMIPITVLIIPSNILNEFNMFVSMNAQDLLYLIIAVISVIILRHIEPIIQLIKGQE
jgi:acyl phosphate:glycerol-3-phosphate acyltransferase